MTFIDKEEATLDRIKKSLKKEIKAFFREFCRARDEHGYFAQPFLSSPVSFKVIATIEGVPIVVGTILVAGSLWEHEVERDESEMGWDHCIVEMDVVLVLALKVPLVDVGIGVGDDVDVDVDVGDGGVGGDDGGGWDLYSYSPYDQEVEQEVAGWLVAFGAHLRRFR
ncbi:hypothetical protein Cgig2_028284 [Carnegiea gigantea]|uniref:Uncharacterized protein n=1 Tax=Carnegiea gigantea TaxID=171969 RepID=A0A9Q1JLJ0_9CARY|nr:hypothetical protein Cgig2_028284 [Carnegiea gigantea]